MNIFIDVSKGRKILDRILGIFFILIGVVIGVFLVPDLIPLLKRTPYLLLEPQAGVRHELLIDWFWQFVGWILTFFSFSLGRSFLRDAQKSSVSRK